MPLLAFVLVASDSGDSAAAFKLINAGFFSQEKAPSRVVVESPTGLSDLWARVRPDKPKPPVVDFEKEFVVAIFLGPKPTGGYAVVVTGVEKTAEGWLVAYEEKCPPEGAMVSQVITSPYSVIRVSGKRGPVSFSVGSCE